MRKDVNGTGKRWQACRTQYSNARAGKTITEGQLTIRPSNGDPGDEFELLLPRLRVQLSRPDPDKAKQVDERRANIACETTAVWSGQGCLGCFAMDLSRFVFHSARL